jgi:hypothetical protein
VLVKVKGKSGATVADGVGKAGDVAAWANVGSGVAAAAGTGVADGSAAGACTTVAVGAGVAAPHAPSSSMINTSIGSDTSTLKRFIQHLASI